MALTSASGREEVKIFSDAPSIVSVSPDLRVRYIGNSEYFPFLTYRNNTYSGLFPSGNEMWKVLSLPVSGLTGHWISIPPCDSK